MKRKTIQEIEKIYYQPLLDLVYQAASIHRKNFPPNEVQVCTLLSIKTGGCAEDCGYCSQSAHHNTKLEKEKLLAKETVIQNALKAKENGSTRFCMGAAWREARNNNDFQEVLGMVKSVKAMGLEVCATLGMLNADQAKQLKKAGLYAYNHNLDTGKNYYNKVITTRTYEERLHTIKNVIDADISLCCGGILGLGEKEEDRIDLLHTLTSLSKPPESIPVNALVPVEGTPLEKQKRVTVWEMIRMIATARILFPKAMVRLSAGRKEMPETEQALCFLAGANSIFAGDKLLTTPNPETDQDSKMFELLGLSARPPYQEESISNQEVTVST